MRKLYMFNLMTLDGYFARPDGSIDWHNVDDEFNRFAEDQLTDTGGLVFGRVTYDLMAGYWPTEQGTEDDHVIAKAMNSLPKLVFSRSLDKVDWQNSRLAKGDLKDEITKFKQASDKPVGLFGSSNLAGSLIPLGLIDEFRILVAPIVLGAGKPLFPNVQNQFKLKRESTRNFKNGNVLLTYSL